MTLANGFLLGAIAAGTLIAALFFLRFWRQTRDPLFLLFAIAFALEGTSRVLLATEPDPSEGRPLFYLIRLLAYAIILAGIIQKNVRAGR